MPLNSLLEAAKAGREATAVLTLRSQRSSPIDTVVTLQPMRGSNGCPSALAILRMPPPSVEQFLDPALMRHALLDETFRQIGATLDLDQMARGLINIVVPHFCNSAGLLLLESLVAADEPPAPQTDGSAPAAPDGGRHRQQRPRLGRHVPHRGGAAVPDGHALHRVHGTRASQSVSTP